MHVSGDRSIGSGFFSLPGAALFAGILFGLARCPRHVKLTLHVAHASSFISCVSVIPIFSFYDRSNNAAPGVAAYIDNVSISVTTSVIPEPSVGVLGILGSLLFLRRRRR